MNHQDQNSKNNDTGIHKTTKPHDEVIPENAGPEAAIGEIGTPAKDEKLHSKVPKSNHMGIDKGRWAD